MFATLFAQQVRARKARRLQRAPRRIPRQQQPDRQREAYYARLRPIVGQTFGLVRAHVLPQLGQLVRAARYRADSLREDNWTDALDVTLRGIAEEVLRDWPDERLLQLGQQVAGATSDFQRGQLLQQFRSALGVDPILAEPWLGDMLQGFASENVRLIRSLPEESLDGLRDKVVYSVRSGARAEDIARDLIEQEGVTERRAALIAHDQVGKLNGDLNRARQQELGVDSYIWRGKKDNREREEHLLREGKRFLWSQPPEDGHPGEPIRCRCEAEPDLGSYWESLG